MSVRAFRRLGRQMMLAGRLFGLATDILREYDEFHVIQHLNEAIAISSQRTGAQAQQYSENARKLRTWAQDVIARGHLASYPIDIQKTLAESKYAMGLPSNIAKVILAGFPDDINKAISSAELRLYLDLATTTKAELSSTNVVAKAFKIDRINIPPNEVSFDLIIPRRLFDSRAQLYIEILEKFVRIMTYIEELATGTRRSPTLVYTSTSDPVTGLAVVYAAGWAFLRFYKLALEVADKQLSLLKTIREFRASSLGPVPEIEERTNSIVENALSDAVDAAVSSVPPKVEGERLNEIKIALTKDAKAVVKYVADGARVAITLESLSNIQEVFKDIPNVSREKVDEVLNTTSLLEQRVEQSLILLGQPEPSLITMERTKTS
jgi:hypothetical protein